jgi:hypothetical protein
LLLQSLQALFLVGLFAQLGPELKHGSARAQADRFGLGLEQLPQGVGGFGHTVRHAPQGPAYHVRPQEGNPPAKIGIGPTAGCGSLTNAGGGRRVPKRLPGGQGHG